MFRGIREQVETIFREDPAANPAPNATANNDFVMVLSFWLSP